MLSAEQRAGRSTVSVGCADPDTAFAASLAESISAQRQPFELRLFHSVAELDLAAQSETFLVALIWAELIPDPSATAERLRALGVVRLVAYVDRLDDPRIGELSEAGFKVLFRHASPLAFGEAFSQLPNEPAVPGELRLLADHEGTGILVFYSPKGGTGKTTLAVNLAILYAQKGRRVLVIDLAQFGTVASYVRMTHRGRGLSTLITLLQQEPAILESRKFEEYLVAAIATYPVKGGAVDLLLAAPPTKMDQLGLDQTEGLLNKVAQSGRYDLVLVDTASELAERTLGALGRATRIVMVLTPDFNAGWLSLELTHVLKALYIPRNHVAMVFNRVARDLSFSIGEFARLVDWPLVSLLPESYREVQGGVNLTGLPAAGAGSPLVLAMKRLAQQLYPVYGAHELRSDWLWPLKRFLGPGRRR